MEPRYISVNNERNAFTIRVRGQGKWDLNRITITPDDSLFNCGDDSKPTPIQMVDETVLSCKKDPNKTIYMTIKASPKTVGSIPIYSVADDLRRQNEDLQIGQGDQIAALAERTNELESKLVTLNARADN